MENSKLKGAVAWKEKQMDFHEIRWHVKRAINCVFAHDSKLFSVKASEWAIAHRLAVYLEQRLPEWNVDCEYNRQEHDEDPKADESGNYIRPDIIIHHRGETSIEHNLLVIELKKREEKSDLKKVCELTNPPSGEREYQYQYGLALSFFPTLKIHWFENGAELH